MIIFFQNKNKYVILWQVIKISDQNQIYSTLWILAILVCVSKYDENMLISS